MSIGSSFYNKMFMNVPEKNAESDQGAIFAHLSEKANENSDMGLHYRLTYN